MNAMPPRKSADTIRFDPAQGKADDHHSVYANALRGGFTNFDLRFSFGQLREIQPNVPVNEDLVTVTMAPAFAKIVVQQMTQVLQAYENQFGVISLPKPPVTPQAPTKSKPVAPRKRLSKKS